jgi:hypothetical protein
LETLGDQAKAPHLTQAFDEHDDRPRLFHCISTRFLIQALQQSSNDKKIVTRRIFHLNRHKGKVVKNE